jgi:polysaccharide pyruvyl transferase CsaB
LQVVLAGFYGAGNTGDEAILSAIVGSIRNEHPNAQFTVLSFNPSATTAAHGVQSLYRPNIGREWIRTPFAETYRAVRQADVVLIGGGGILQNVHNNMTVPRYLQTAVLAKALGMPVVYYGIGAGPIDGRIMEAQIRSVCNAGDRIIVRDEESKRQLTEVGVNGDLIEVGVDPVFDLDADGRERADDILKAEGVNMDNALLGVSVRHHELPTKSRVAIAQFLDDLSTAETEVVFVPFGKGSGVSDESVSEDIARRMKSDTTTRIVSYGHSPETVLSIVERMDFVLGMRLHSVIMAAIAGVPVLGIPYHPKVRSVLHRLGYEERHHVESPTGLAYEDLMDAYSNLEADGSQLESKTRERGDELRRKARQQSSLLETLPSRRPGYARSVMLLCSFVITTVMLRVEQFRSDVRDDHSR